MFAVAGSKDMPVATSADVFAVSAKHVNDFAIAAKALPARSLVAAVQLSSNC